VRRIREATALAGLGVAMLAGLVPSCGLGYDDYCLEELEQHRSPEEMDDIHELDEREGIAREHCSPERIEELEKDWWEP
jgi:hypothetical protein